MKLTTSYRTAVIAGVLLTIFAAMFPALSDARLGDGIVPYDAELYETGYQVFLMNGNVADGLKLAENALRQRPHDAVWRKRAAQCAEWSGAPAVALKHWSYLALTTGDLAANDRALKLTVGLNDTRSRMELLKKRLQKDNDITTVRAFVETAESLGETAEAIAVLEPLTGGVHAKYAHEALGRLYEAKPVARQTRPSVLSAHLAQATRSQRRLFAGLLHSSMARVTWKGHT